MEGIRKAIAGKSEYEYMSVIRISSLDKSDPFSQLFVIVQ
jgi:hypothetical protein